MDRRAFFETWYPGQPDLSHLSMESVWHSAENWQYRGTNGPLDRFAKAYELYGIGLDQQQQAAELQQQQQQAEQRRRESVASLRIQEQQQNQALAMARMATQAVVASLRILAPGASQPTAPTAAMTKAPGTAAQRRRTSSTELRIGSGATAPGVGLNIGG
jgi:hypothetical protein